MSVPPSGLVLYTNKWSQSYDETGEVLTYDEIMECEAENFVEYVNELAEKAILLKHREDPERGVIVKPSVISGHDLGNTIKRLARLLL